MADSNLGYIAVNERAGVLGNSSMGERLAEVDRIMDTAIAELGAVEGMVVVVRRTWGWF